MGESEKVESWLEKMFEVPMNFVDSKRSCLLFAACSLRMIPHSVGQAGFQYEAGSQGLR